MKPLRLELLGHPTIRRGEATITGFRYSKAQALLYYLAVTGQPHTRSALVGLLWGDMPEANARQNLRRVLTTLRPLMGDHLLITRQNVAFNQESPYWLDVAEFEARVGNGTNASDINLSEGLGLYRGDFLEGFYVSRAPDFEAWLLTERARLRKLALQGLDTLASHYTQQGDLAQGIETIRRLLGMEPWHEEAHQQLMRLLARSGQRSAALVQFQMCRQILLEELGVEPAKETKTLYERIRAARPVAPPHLPASLTPFINREQELAEIGQLLADPTVRLITITGPGGIGKTRLALEAAVQQHQTMFRDAYFVPLEATRSPDDIVAAIAGAVGFQFHGPLKPKQQLLSGLRDRTMVLVLDNFDHLLDSGLLVSDILKALPGLSILTTSRERLDLWGETLFPLEGLDYPAGDGSDSGQAYGAVELFMQTARRVQPSFRSGHNDSLHTGRICRLVEGMPLAIELAAAWTNVLSPQDIAAKIKDDLDILRTTSRNLPPRHLSVRAVFEHSWRSLSQDEQAVFKKLSVFGGGFDQAAAEQVAGASIAVLDSLLDKSLLSRIDADRYKLHELLRQFANEKLTTTPDGYEETLNRHCRYYAMLIHGYELENKSNVTSTPGNLFNTLTDWQNVQAAWYRAIDRSFITEIGNFTYFLSLFYEFRGLTQDGAETFNWALQQLKNQPNSVNPIIMVRVLSHAGWFHLALSQLAQAEQLLDEALALSSTLDESHSVDVGWAFIYRGWVSRLREQSAKAREFFRQSEERFQSSNSQMGMFMYSVMNGEVAYDTGNYDTARQYYEQALTQAENFQFMVGTLNALTLLGNTYSALGDYQGAVDCLRRVLLVSRDMLLIAPLLTGLMLLEIIGIAALYGRQGDYNMALELLLVTLNHPQCGIIARRKVEIFLNELRPHIAEEDIAAMMDKAKRGQLSNRYLEPNFTIDAALVDRLLTYVDQIT